MHVTHAMCGMRDQESKKGLCEPQCCDCVPHENCGIHKEQEWMERHAKKVKEEVKQEKAMWKKIHFPEQENDLSQL